MSKNKNIFLTSDVWFNRPIGDFSSMLNEEYNNMVIGNWNNTVNKNDVVYVLGGFGIGDCYDIVLKLNGEIHFLNSVFSKSDRDFRNSIKEGVENSVDKELINRVFSTPSFMEFLKSLSDLLNTELRKCISPFNFNTIS